MPRIRSQSQSFNLYTSVNAATGQMSGSGDILQIHRLTSIGGPEWTYERAPISVIGKLAPITRDTTDSPTVSVPFTYYFTDFENEKNLGFDKKKIESDCIEEIFHENPSIYIFFYIRHN